MFDMDGFLGAVGQVVKSEAMKKKIVARHPLKKEWRERFDALEVLQDDYKSRFAKLLQAIEMEGLKIQHIGHSIWTEIEHELQEFREMELDKKKNEIQVLDRDLTGVLKKTTSNLDEKIKKLLDDDKKKK